MKKHVSIWMILILCLFIPRPAEADDLPPRGNWKCTALDSRTLVLTGDYDELQQSLFRQKSAARDTGRKLPRWAEEFNFHAAGTEAIAAYRPAAVELLLNKADRITLESAQGKALNVIRTGVWLTPEGLARFPDKEGRKKISKNADLAHHCFLELDRPLTGGEEITVTMPAGETVDFVYRPETPSPTFKVNQIGYMPEARKYAYLGAWLGTAGPLRLHPLAGRPFRLVEAESGKTVFTGTLQSARRIRPTPRERRFPAKRCWNWISRRSPRRDDIISLWTAWAEARISGSAATLWRRHSISMPGACFIRDAASHGTKAARTGQRGPAIRIVSAERFRRMTATTTRERTTGPGDSIPRTEKALRSIIFF